MPVISFSNDSSVAGNGVFILGTVPAQSIARVVEYARGKGWLTDDGANLQVHVESAAGA